jgi:hypothetical protein
MADIKLILFGLCILVAYYLNLKNPEKKFTIKELFEEEDEFLEERTNMDKARRTLLYNSFSRKKRNITKYR